MKRPTYFLLAFPAVLGLLSWFGWCLGRGWIPTSAPVSKAKSRPAQIDSAAPKKAGISAGDGSESPPPLTDEELAQGLAEFSAMSEQADADDLGSEFSMFRKMARLAQFQARATPEQRQKLALSDEQLREALPLFSGFLSMMKIPTAKELRALLEDPSAEQDEKNMRYMAMINGTPLAALDMVMGELRKTQPAAWAKGNLYMLFTSAAGADYAKAMDAATSIADPDLRKAAMNGAGQALASLFPKNPRSVPEDRDQLVKDYLENPSAISGDQRRRNFGGIISQRLTWEKPEQVLAWVDSLGLSAEARQWADDGIASALAKKSSAEAGEWQLSRTPPDKTASVIGEIISRWTKSTKEIGASRTERIAAAAEWLNARGRDPNLGDGMKQLSDAYFEIGEIPAAVEWAKAIPDEKRRTEAMLSLQSQIKRRYPDDWQERMEAP